MVASKSKPEGSAALLDYAPQNQIPAMQLRDRRERKAPRRYTEELAREKDGESRNLSTKIPKHGAYRGPVIEYNPNLSPAVFPTLDVREGNPNHQSLHAQHIHSIQHKISHNCSASSSHLLPHQKSPFEAALSSRDDRGQLNSLDPDSIKEHHPTNPHYQAMDPLGNRPHYDTNDDSYTPVWWNNVQDMVDTEGMDERCKERATEDRMQMFMDGMATSDEEEEPKVDEKHPSWDDIPLALQMEMIDQAAGDDTLVTQAALMRLRLTAAQQHTAIADYRLQLDREKEEDADIARHRELMHDILLNGPKPYSTPQGFQSLAYVNLYKNLDRSDHVVTGPDVANARAYMTFCGLDARFLHTWVKPVQASVGRPGSPVCLEVEDEYDAQYPYSVSLRESISNKNVNPSSPPNPSTPSCTHSRLPNGTAPRFGLIPVAQRHQTPNTLSPIPLRLDTPILNEPAVKLPTLNPLTSHRSTSPTNEVDVDGIEPLHCLLSSSHTADRNPEKGEPIHRGFPLSIFRNVEQGPVMPSPSTSSTSSVLGRRDGSSPRHGCSESDSAPQPKRKRPKTAVKTLPGQPLNGAFCDIEIVINGTNGVESKPLPCESPIQQSAVVAPAEAMNGAVQRVTSMPSVTQEDGLQGHTVAGDVESSVADRAEQYRMPNGMVNGTSNGFGTRMLGKDVVGDRGVVHGAGKNGSIGIAKVKKKAGRPRKIKI
ncbi:MAG: hypothetical protein Q9209_006956 [Squamulea sp. 1 TL-2023]